jgi:hypothetical protein
LSTIVCKARRRFTRFSSAEWFNAITVSSTTTLITNVICTAGVAQKNDPKDSLAYSFSLYLQGSHDKAETYPFTKRSRDNKSLRE